MKGLALREIDLVLVELRLCLGLLGLERRLQRGLLFERGTMSERLVCLLCKLYELIVTDGIGIDI